MVSENKIENLLEKIPYLEAIWSFMIHGKKSDAIKNRGGEEVNFKPHE